MQVVYLIGMNATDYAKGEMHLKVIRPLKCNHCRSLESLRSLGYYERSSTASATGHLVLFKVRRFICIVCLKTTSLLPSFAQPYRLVCSVTIQRHFEGSPSTLDTSRWKRLLCRYLKRFRSWLPKLASLLGDIFGVPPPHPCDDPWSLLRRMWKGIELDAVTHQMINDFRLTIFGKYLCHQWPALQEIRVFAS